MARVKKPFGLLLVFLLPLSKGAGQELLPVRPFTLRKQLPVSEALALLKQQTGLAVADRRNMNSDAPIKLDLVRADFWTALTVIARQANAGISLYQSDGVVALVNGPYRPVPASHHGIFRIAARRLAVTRDLERGISFCSVHLEAAWEPWFQPFYLEVGPCSAEFSPPRQGKAWKAALPGQGQVAVAGRNAIELDLRFPAPPRSAANLERLQGKFKIIGPQKMLSFRFDALQPISKPDQAVRKKQEGVTVSLTRLALQADRWVFDVVIQNPPGGPKFESYQSWLDNNKIHLEKNGGKILFSPNSADEELLENISSQRAAIRYHFSLRNRTPDFLGNLQDWTLVYTTPGRIVEVEIPYEFKGLALP